MWRSGFIFGIGASAAVLTFFAQPVVQASADQWMPVAPVASSSKPLTLPGMRPASIAISPIHMAGIERTPRSIPITNEAQEMGGKTMKPTRRLVREGCETALSALVGPEARRMLPGRCIS